MTIYRRGRFLLSILLVVSFLASCAPGTATPTPTTTSTATPTPTITPTPGPQSLADAPDLSTWVEEYVHAYGGNVTVNDAEMDAAQLIAAIHQNPDIFTQTRKINGIDISFLTINEVPLAYKDDRGYWKEATIKYLDSLAGRSTGTQLIGDKLNDPVYTSTMLKNFDYVTIDYQLNTEVLLSDGREMHLLDMVKNGEDLSKVDTMFDWQYSDPLVEYANANGLKVQGHHLFVNWSNLTDGIKNGLKSGQISYDDYEKFLKVYVQTLVKHYDQNDLKIDEWTATNEVAAALLWSDDKDILHELFIKRHLMTKICQWVKEVDPQIKTIINEDGLFGDPASGLLDTFVSLVGNSLEEGAPIDEIGMQNHLWIYTFPTEAQIDKTLARLNKLGLPIVSTEITISISDKNNFIPDDEKEWNIEPTQLLNEQAKAYSLIFSKIKNNALFGFTDARSMFTDQGSSFDLTAKALLLDEEMRPKPAYYSILKVIYTDLDNKE